jgi:DNA polymerase-3 subunit chi
MATKASFYFNVANREQALCQLVGKAWKRRLAVGVATDSVATSQSLDRLLWEVPPTGFLPHCLADHPLATDTPVLLGHDLDALLPRDVLFNCTGQDLPAGLNAARLVEIVARDDEAGRQLARQRVRAYQQAGYDVEFTDMAKPHGR